MQWFSASRLGHNAFDYGWRLCAGLSVGIQGFEELYSDQRLYPDKSGILRCHKVGHSTYGVGDLYGYHVYTREEGLCWDLFCTIGECRKLEIIFLFYA
jgi:hypothetical protein